MHLVHAKIKMKLSITPSLCSSLLIYGTRHGRWYKLKGVLANLFVNYVIWFICRLLWCYVTFSVASLVKWKSNHSLTCVDKEEGSFSSIFVALSNLISHFRYQHDTDKRLASACSKANDCVSFFCSFKKFYLVWTRDQVWVWFSATMITACGSRWNSFVISLFHGEYVAAN